MGNGRIDMKRRYVRTGETVGYVLFDSSKTLNIDTYAQRFVLDVVKIDLGWQTIITGINSVWDIINDSFVGVIVDKTRTRYGKFRPWLMAFAIPGTIGALIYWLTPMLFGPDPRSVSKAVFWLILCLLREGGSTFRGISEAGMLATVTPNPEERLSILTKSELFSSFYENIPEWAMSILIDLVNKKKIGITMKNLYAGMGSVMTLISGAMAIYCFLVTKERVQQSIEKPDLKTGFLTIVKNRPMLMLMLSEFLESFTITTGMDNYYLDVLGSMFIKTIITAPGSVTYYASFIYAGWARRRFSTKQLWIFTTHFGDLLMIIVYLIGSIGGKGEKGFYRNIKIMLPTLILRDSIFKATYGIKKILPRELFNEALDYCEWKNGIRTEGMTSAAKGMLTKIVKNTKNTLQMFMLKLIGYDLSAEYGGQSNRTKYLMFVMCTIVPTLSGLVSIIPKFLYNISHDERKQMYAELELQRAAQQLSFTAEAEKS